MPSTAVRITEGALNHPHVPIANRDEVSSAGASSHVLYSGGSSPHGLDGTSESKAESFTMQESFSKEESSFTSMSQETAVNTAINSSSSKVAASDKPIFAEPEYGRPSAPTVPAESVAADEIDMKKAENAGEALSPSQTVTGVEGRDFAPETTQDDS